MKRALWLIYSFHFLAFFAVSMMNTQMIPFLTKLGYDVLQRGYILALNAIVAIFGQFIFGYLCDRYHKMKRFLSVAYIILLFSSIAMYLIQKEVFYYHLFVVAMMGGMVKVVTSLDETWMLALDDARFGKQRAAGALGLTFGATFAGYIVRSTSYTIFLYCFIMVSVILGMVMYRIKDHSKKSHEQIQFSSLKELLKNHQYVLLVTIYLLIYMIGTADQYVVIDKMLKLGASHTQIGWKWALQSLMEIPLFLGAGYLLKKCNIYFLFLFGTFMYGIKFILYGWASNPLMIIFTTILQLVTLPIIMLTSKVLVNEITPSKLQASAQMFAMAFFIGVSGLITPLITSFLSHWLGYNYTLYVVAGFTIVPFLLILYYRRIANHK